MCSHFSCTVFQSGPKLLLPLRRQVRVLRHDVLDRVAVDVDPLLAVVVLELAEEVVAAAEVVDVLD